MNLLDEAYKELFQKENTRTTQVKYHNKFKAYNANIKMNSNNITVNLSKHWQEISPEIQKGLIQELLIKIFKTKQQTIHTELYNSFIKNMPRIAPKTHNHPILEESFNRINEKFFTGIIEKPNLKLGKGITKLGTYEYATDTITISETLLKYQDLMDYVMHHEILHKKHQYTSAKGRACHHSHAFRKEEKAYPNSEQLEKQLQQHVRYHKRYWNLARFKYA